MDRLAILLTICGVVISGCSETVDSTYRESSESRSVPTIHLVVDEKRDDFIPGSQRSVYRPTSIHSNNRSVFVQYHVQADRPMEKDTFVLVRTSERGTIALGTTVKWDESRRRESLVVILAGSTQSKVLEMFDHNLDDEKYIPAVQTTLPESHERGSLLPTWVEYRDATGAKQAKHLLVEYPFNPYKVGSPRNIGLKWQGNQ